MSNKDHTRPPADHDLDALERLCRELSRGRHERASELFELTVAGSAPRRIAGLAESFGMMLVRVEAGEYRLEKTLAGLTGAGRVREESRRQPGGGCADPGKGLAESFPGRIVGQSPRMRRILDQVEGVAKTPVNVLIAGETGTGKELVAKALHLASPRKAGPFVAVNCSAVPESLFESELFGIEKGVATGVNMRRGLMEQAHGGTLFLDEVCDLPLSCQAKILRALEERELTRLGGSASIPVNLRLVTATNKDLHAEVQAGRFRRDLFFRLNVVCFCLPPLRERRDDIPLLLRYFLDRHCRSMNRPLPRVDTQAMSALLEHDWPGNVRELKNEVERLVVLCSSSTVGLEDLSEHVRGRFRPAGPRMREASHEEGAGFAHQNLAEHERALVARALESTRGNKTQAARLLGISREGLRKKLKRLQAGDVFPHRAAGGHA